MVRSRSEANLTRLLANLCRQSDQCPKDNHLQLPNCQTAIKASSCSNLNELIEQKTTNELITLTVPIRKDFKSADRITDNPKTTTGTMQDWKSQDYTCRLQNRLKARAHLRKFFLSLD